MLSNFEARGCPLLGLTATATLAAHAARLTSNCWQRGEARSMGDVYRSCLEPRDRRRIERLELFDEFEEWDLIQVGAQWAGGRVRQGAAWVGPGLPAGVMC